MSSAPLANYNVYYAGWSRDTVHPTSGMGIHHPSGDIKKISQAGLFSRADGIDEGNGAADCWQVLWPTAACTEPGSSGSPIFNASHKLIGQLYGGPSACGASQMWDYYGRFYVSWTGGGTSATRLSDWLDPVSLNPATVEGYDPNGPSRPTVNFSADVTSSCLGTISFTDQSSNLPNGWHWDFGDMTTSTLQNPQHLYTANGTYTVQLIATNTIGSDTLTKTSYITINMPAAPSVAGDSVCNSGVCVLNATGSGILKWYSDQTGINLIGTGPTYTTPTLSTTTNYWVSDSVLSPTQSGGKPNNTGGGADLTNQNQYEIFDCYTPITLVSVDVYASVTGIRTFELRNSNGTSLQTAAVNITSTTGLFTCPLNFDIPAGTNFQLGLTSGSNCNLYRNNAGISYPYTTPGMFSITTSSASSNPLSYYYYCYHWVVKYHDCVSPLQQVTALVENCTGIGETLSGRVSLSPNPTAGPIYIQLPQQFGAIRSLEIYNCIGQLQKIQSDITLVDISGFNAGLYFLVVTNEKGEKAEAKVVKE
jgi:PKD repeat protein